MHDFPQWLHCSMVWGPCFWRLWLTSPARLLALKLQFGCSQTSPAKAVVSCDCCVLFLSSSFLSSFHSVSLLMVSTPISTTPRQADLSWASSCQSCSTPHFTKSCCTRSFQQHFWPPADRAPCAGCAHQHTHTHLTQCHTAQLVHSMHAFPALWDYVCPRLSARSKFIYNIMS